MNTRVSSRILPGGQTVQLQIQCLALVLPRQLGRFSDSGEIQEVYISQVPG